MTAEIPMDGTPAGPGLLDGKVAVITGASDTGGFLRPVYQDGALCLTITPGLAGRLRPFEVEHPHQCCGSH